MTMIRGRPWIVVIILLVTPMKGLESPQCGPDFFIVNKSTNKCIDVSGYPGIANEANVQSWDCELNIDNTDQLWGIDRHGRIINKVSGKCLDISGYRSSSNGANIQLYTCDDPDVYDTDHIWEFVPAADDPNVFQIRNTNTTKCVDVQGRSSTRNGANIRQYECEHRYHHKTDQWWFKVFTN